MLSLVRSSYQRDDWRRLQLNDAVEDTLSKILRFGFDIDRVETEPTSAKTVRDQILAWAKHIASEIPSSTTGNWQDIYEFTFDALYAPDAVPGSDDTPIGTEADLVAALQLEDVEFERDYALQSREIEKEHLADHDLSLSKARTRQVVLNRFAANPMPPALALLFRKIRYTYQLRERLLAQVEMDDDDDFEYYKYLMQIQLRRRPESHRVDSVQAWQTQAIANHRPIYTGCANHPTPEQLRLTLLAALVGYNQQHTYDECMVASHTLGAKYTDRVGYRDILDSADSFIRNEVGTPLLEAIIAIGKQFIANFEEHQAALDPPLPHPGPLVAQWFDSTTGRVFPE